MRTRQRVSRRFFFQRGTPLDYDDGNVTNPKNSGNYNIYYGDVLKIRIVRV